MNQKIGNIMVKDIDDGKINLFSSAKKHRKKEKRLGINQKHLQKSKQRTFVHVFIYVA
jgi:hypothetical protein